MSDQPDSEAVTGPSHSPERLAMLALLRRQSEEAVRFSGVFGTTHNLHQTDVSALAAIAQASADGAPIGPAMLAETLRLSRPATTALVDRLEAVGHVVRRPDPDDRRRTILEMQPAAMELAGAFFGRLGMAYAEVMDRFSAEELEVVSSFMESIIEATVATREGLAVEPALGAPDQASDRADRGARDGR